MPFSITTIVFLSLYVVAASLYVIFSAHYVVKVRAVAKPLLMLFLILAVMFTTYDLPMLITGLLLDLFGDIVLLNRKSNKFFILGGLFFFMGHILYNAQFIVILAQKTQYFNYPLGIVLTIAELVVFASLFLLVFKYVFKLEGKLFLIVSAYFTTLFMLIPLVINLVIQASIWSLFILGGVILFAISDSLIYIDKFWKPNLKYRNFFVSITYALAQILIVIGLILTISVI